MHRRKEEGSHGREAVGLGKGEEGMGIHGREDVGLRSAGGVVEVARAGAW
jgi:hypothetical protein